MPMEPMPSEKIKVNITNQVIEQLRQEATDRLSAAINREPTEQEIDEAVTDIIKERQKILLQ